MLQFGVAAWPAGGVQTAPVAEAVDELVLVQQVLHEEVHVQPFSLSFTPARRLNSMREGLLRVKKFAGKPEAPNVGAGDVLVLIACHPAARSCRCGSPRLKSNCPPALIVNGGTLNLSPALKLGIGATSAFAPTGPVTGST